MSLEGIFPKPIEYSNGEIKIACIGDSITYGHGIEDREANCYPAKLSRLLGEGYRVKNFGVSNRCATFNYPFGYFFTGFEGKTVKFKPHITLIMLGTNDTKPCIWNERDFRRGYTRLIKRISAVCGRIYIMLPPPAFNDDEPYGKYRINNALISGRLREILNSLAREVSAEIIDIYTPLMAHGDLFSDGIHPDAEGAEIIAETIYNKLCEVEK